MYIIQQNRKEASKSGREESQHLEYSRCSGYSFIPAKQVYTIGGLTPTPSAEHGTWHHSSSYRQPRSKTALKLPPHLPSGIPCPPRSSSLADLRTAPLTIPLPFSRLSPLLKRDSQRLPQLRRPRSCAVRCSSVSLPAVEHSSYNHIGFQNANPALGRVFPPLSRKRCCPCSPLGMERSALPHSTTLRGR